MSTLTICLLVFVIANEASTPLAVLAVPILALNSKWIEADSHIWSEPLFMLLLSISVLVCSFHKPRKQKSATYLSVAGIPIGLSCRVSPVALLTIPIFSIFLWLFNNVKRKIILLGFLVCSALIILPWTLRNALTTHSFVPVSSNGGMNFYIGNNPIVFNIKRSGQIYGSKVLSEIRQGTSSISETYIDKEFYKRSFEYIKSKPIAFVSRFISKAKEFWTFFPHGSPVKRLITIVLLFPCVVLGAFRVLRHKMFGGILALVLLSVGLFTYSSYWLWWRMALPYFPFAWLLVFHGVLLIIARIVNRFPQFRWMEETILA